MLIIGLYGGTAAIRDDIALQLMRHPLANVGLYTLNATPGMNAQSRADKLGRVLQGLGHKVKGQNLVIAHVLSNEEAQLIRARGGRMWHVFGKVPAHIAIQEADLHVTDLEGGYRHYLDPIEALSRELLAVRLAEKEGC